MPRKARVFWHGPTNAWRSDVGPFNDKGRRTPVYFREIPPTEKGRRLAQERLEAYLKGRDKAEAAATEDGSNPRVWAGVVRPYLAEFQKRVDADERGERTLRSHAERLKRFLDFTPDEGPYAGIRMGDRLALTLTDDDGAWLVADLKARSLRRPKGGDGAEPREAKGCGPRRIIGILRSVNACFNWAASDIPGREPRRILPANPFRGLQVDRPVRGPRKLPTRAEFARFLRHARAEVEAWTPIGVETKRCSGCVRTGRTSGPGCRRSHNRRALFDRAVLLLCRVQFHVGARPDELCRATRGEVPIPGTTETVPGWEPRAWRDPALDQWWGRIIVFAKTTRVTGELRRITVPPTLSRAIERFLARGLHPERIFPRLSRGGEGTWDSTALAGKVRPWRDDAGLGRHFVLYALRHRMYTAAVHEADLTADRAGAVGGSSGQTVRANYLHADDRAIFEAARRIALTGRPAAKQKA
jgi:hypothetical protein